MNKEEIYKEIKQVCGRVPLTFQYVPDEFLQAEWEQWKSMMSETTIPMKWKQLINLGIASANGDRYGVIYRTEAAKMAGATDEELKAVAYLAKVEMGWRSFLQANNVDVKDFKKDTQEMFQYIQQKGGFRQATKEKASI